MFFGNHMKRLIVFAMTLLLSSMSWASFDDGQETHGGDEIVGEFFQIAQSLNAKISKCPESLFPVANFKNLFDEKLKMIVVTTEENVFYENDEVSAVNYPKMDPPRIVLSRSRWNLQYQSYAKYELLVLHEMLPIVGLVDSRFTYSEGLLNDINLFQKMDVAKLMRRFATQSPSGAKMSLDYIRSDRRVDINNAIEALFVVSNKIATVSDRFWSKDLKEMGSLFISNIDMRSHKHDIYLACAGRSLKGSSNPDAQTLLADLTARGWRDSIITSCLELTK